METVIVIIIVAVALAFGLRTLYRSLTGKESHCNCGTTCPKQVREACKEPTKQAQERGGGESE